MLIRREPETKCGEQLLTRDCIMASRYKGFWEKKALFAAEESHRKCSALFLETAGESRVSLSDCSAISRTRLTRGNVCTLNSINIGMKSKRSPQTFFVLLCVVLKDICVAKVDI